MANIHASKGKPVQVNKKKWPWVVGILALLAFGGVFFLLVLGLIFSQLLSTSTSSSPGMYEDSMGLSSSSGYKASPELEATTASGDFITTTADDGATTTVIEQKILKTGELSVVVNSTDEAVKGISQLAEARGGFVLSSETYTATDDTQRGSISIRVPAEQFTSTLVSIKDSVEVVESESVSGVDVTEEYIDLQARLKNAQALEADYLNILSQSTNVEDTLKVTKALASVREQVEVLQGQINYINARSDYSTISVTLSERPNVIPSVSEKFDLLLVFQQAFQALVLLARAALVTLIWVVVIGGPVFLVFWLVWKLARWGRHHGKPHSNS